VTVHSVCGLRAFVRRQVELAVDGQRLFEPFPVSSALAMLEWGLNYLLANRLNRHLLLHAGAVERRGVAVLLPALPGSGKSTLTAALVCHGYRLLSDEFGVVDLASGLLLPLLRPIGLKNASIDVITRMAPDVRVGPRFTGTHKGTVAHLAPGRRSVRMRHIAAQPGIVLFPRYDANARKPRLETIDPARALAKMSVNAFNYRLLGCAAFDAIVGIVRTASLHRLSFSHVGDALGVVDQLVGHTEPGLQRTGT
jgi:HprK-related kinase A